MRLCGCCHTMHKEGTYVFERFICSSCLAFLLELALRGGK